MQKNNYIIYVRYIGYGNGADKTKVTPYQIGNPNIIGEIQDKEIQGSGARSITIEDLQVMSNAELIVKNPNTDYPTIPVYVPSLNGAAANGKCTDANKKTNLLNTYTNIQKNNFNIKPEYASLLNETFKDEPYYWLASRLVNSYTSSASFHVRAVNSTSVHASTICNATDHDFYVNSVSRGVRPVVYLEYGVTLNKVSTGRWELVQ